MKNTHPPASYLKFAVLGLATAILSWGPMAADARANQDTTWGNTYFMGGAGSVVVNDTRTAFARFTATEDMVVSAADLYANNATSPSLVVSIQADDGDGLPDGTPLASGTITPSGQGWHSVSFTTPTPTLTQGNVYFLVAGTSTPGASFSWRFNNITAGHPNVIQPFGVSDPAWARGQVTPSPTVAAGDSITYLLTTDIGRSVGQPYISIPFQNLGSTVSTQGQRFRFDQAAAGGNNRVTAVNLRLNIHADTPPVEPLDVVLLDAALNTLTTGSIDLSTAPGGAGFYNVDFISQPVLNDDAIYYLGLFSNGSGGNSVQWSGMTTTTAALQSASFQGADAYAVSWNAQSDFDQATMSSDVNRDYYFELALIPEPSTILFMLAPVLLVLVQLRRKI